MDKKYLLLNQTEHVCLWKQKKTKKEKIILEKSISLTICKGLSETIYVLKFIFSLRFPQ